MRVLWAILFPPWPRAEGTEQKVSEMPRYQGRPAEPLISNSLCPSFANSSWRSSFVKLYAPIWKILNHRASVQPLLQYLVASTDSDLCFTSDCLCLISFPNRCCVLCWGPRFPPGYKPSHYQMSFLYLCHHTGSPTGGFHYKLDILVGR